MEPIHAIFSGIYAVANRGFYLMVFLTLMFVFAIIYITRWLDYWEVLPNEILHHHGPLSDLERYPTMNLKFDKEIPDVLEWAMLGSGRLVLHVPERVESSRARQCALHHRQGRSPQEGDEPPRRPRHHRPGGRRNRDLNQFWVSNFG